MIPRAEDQSAKGQLILVTSFGPKKHRKFFLRISALASKKRSDQKNKGTLYH